MSDVAIQVRGPLLAVYHPDGDTMIDPKWLVMGVVLASLSLILNYDLRLGAAASVLLLVVSAIYLWISYRLAPASDEPRSEREAMFDRFSRLSRNRRAARAKELGSQGGSNAG